MDDNVLQELRATNILLEKAVIVAESVLSDLPKETVLVAHRCVILHWFDLPIIDALLQDTPIIENTIGEIYEQLASLPFVERLAWGLAFQSLTREGLLKRFVLTQPDFLRTAASLAAPAYEVNIADERSAAEALFCRIVAGDQRSSEILLKTLQEQAASRKDWQRIANLLLIQDEAEHLSFVQPLPPTEQSWMIRALVYKFLGDFDAAIASYGEAIKLNPKSILAYVSRGTTYAEQKEYKEALVDYAAAIQQDPYFVQAHVNRGNVNIEQKKYKKALMDYNRAIQIDPTDPSIYLRKGNVLMKLRQYEEALIAYDEALRLDFTYTEALEGRRKVLVKLGRFQGAAADSRSIQSRILLSIINYSENYYGKSPTLREISEDTGINSLGQIAYHLNLLEKKGYIQRYGRKSRSFIVLKDWQGPSLTNPVPIAAGPTRTIMSKIVNEVLLLPSEVFLLQVEGNSMIGDSIFEGDLLIVDPVESSIREGDIVVATHLGAATVKRLYRDEEKIVLQPSNPEMSPIYVDRYEWIREWKLQGKVRAIIHRFGPGSSLTNPVPIAAGPTRTIMSKIVNEVLLLPSEVFLLQVEGNSMIGDSIFEGDLLIVDPVESSIREGDIVVATHLDDEGSEFGAATVKHFYPDYETMQIRLQPSNSEMPPIYVDRDEWNNEWIVQGKVIGVIHQFA